MSVIENFAALSVQEQRTFAETLVKTLNSEKTFADFELKIDSVEADDMTGGLTIELSHEGTVEVPREATWTCDDSDEAEDVPEDVKFENYLREDVKKLFKTLSAEIEGYSIEIGVSDANAGKTIEVEVEHLSHEDAGIGHYEFWGEIGYDSQPYCEVSGTITQACTVYPALYVEAVVTTTEDAEEN